jgi:signal transduction histidine kinase
MVIITAAGLVGLAINDQVGRITEEALSYDIELENRSDDLRVAVLDMRHFHRNITFVGPTRRGLVDFETAYRNLTIQINYLDELGITDPNVYTPGELREIAERYYSTFRPAIDIFDDNRGVFDLASDEALLQIAELQGAALEIDQLGEQRAADALRRVDTAGNGARAALLTVLAGLVLAGAGLAYLIVQNTREKQQAARQLERALESKNAFIADASHELRTPLTVLRANAEVGLSLDRSCVHTELLEEIVQESVRMTAIVEDLLFLARSDADAVPLEREWISLGPFFAELAERAGTLAREYGSALKQELDATGRLWIDGKRIEQVVLILVDNAAKYGASGTPILLHSRIQADRLLVEVRDSGPGIPAPDLPMLFDRFYRVDKARSRKQGGTGLGLAIARSIVEGHGGVIEAESATGIGTTMRFTLPLNHQDQPGGRQPFRP